MKKKLAKIIGVIIILAVVVWTIWYFGWFLRPVNSDISLGTIEAFHQIPENSVDVLIYGSSHSWRGIDSVMLQDDYGVSNYNYSCMWQKINTTRLFVNDSFKSQKPKLAIVETYNVNNVLKDTDIVGEVYYTRKIADSPVKREYLKQCFGDDMDKYVAYYFTIGAFHNNWDSISEANYDLTNLKPDNFIKSRGFMSFDEAIHVDMMDSSEYWQEPLGDDALKALDGIVTDCKENGTQILFVTLPYYSGEYMYRDAMAEYAKANGCDYLDMLAVAEEIGINGDTDFSDLEHLNRNGADKVTEYLGNYLQDNYPEVCK